MKYLNDYVEEKQSALFKEYGVFFAFSDKQYKEQAKEGVEYFSMGTGMICPKEHAKEFLKQFNTIYEDGMAEDLAENSREGVIRRELYNHEALYVYSIESTVDALEAYGITEQEIRKVFGKLIEEQREEV